MESRHRILFEVTFKPSAVSCDHLPYLNVPYPFRRSFLLSRALDIYLLVKWFGSKNTTSTTINSSKTKTSKKKSIERINKQFLNLSYTQSLVLSRLRRWPFRVTAHRTATGSTLPIF